MAVRPASIARTSSRRHCRTAGRGRRRGYSAQLAPLIEALREGGMSLPD
jgi:hypothetical protein